MSSGEPVSSAVMACCSGCTYATVSCWPTSSGVGGGRTTEASASEVLGSVTPTSSSPVQPGTTTSADSRSARRVYFESFELAAFMVSAGRRKKWSRRDAARQRHTVTLFSDHDERHVSLVDGLTCQPA